jgi:hypothetical protein
MSAAFWANREKWWESTSYIRKHTLDIFW